MGWGENARLAGLTHVATWSRTFHATANTAIRKRKLSRKKAAASKARENMKNINSHDPAGLFSSQ